jgi:hypothetical protein
MKASFKRPPALDRAEFPQVNALPSIFIAIPCYGGLMTAQTAQGFANLVLSLHASGMRFKHAFLTAESLVTRARNRSVAKFLKTDCSHLLFIDADVGFHAMDVGPLLNADVDVVFGAYPMKQYAWGAMHAAAKAGADVEEMRKAGTMYPLNAIESNDFEIVERFGARLVEVKEASTGFMLLKRSAIERFIAHYQREVAYVSDSHESQGETQWAIFQDALDPLEVSQGHAARWLSEDYWFCRKWQMMGGKVWLALDTKLTHTGSHTWHGDVAALLRTHETRPSAQTADTAPSVRSEELPHRVEVEMVEAAP